MMTLFKVEVMPPPGGEGENAEPVHAEVMKAGPTIRMPYEGDRFTVRDAWGRTHSGVITDIDDLGIQDGREILGENEARASGALQLRVIHLRIAPRAA